MLLRAAEDAWTVGVVMGDGGAIVVRRAGASLAPDIDKAGRASHAVLLWLPALAPPGSDGFVTLSCPLPERVPLRAADLRGPFLGLPRGGTSASIIRTAVEGAPLQLAMIVDHLERLMEPFASLRVTGAAFQSTLWGEVLAAAFNRSITIVGHTERSTLGAPVLGLVVLAMAPTDELSSPVTEGDQEAQPDPLMVEAYAAVHRSTPALIDDLSAVSPMISLQERAW